MLAQPLAFAGQPIAEAMIPQRKPIQQVSSIEPGGALQRGRRVLRDCRFERGKVGFRNVTPGSFELVEALDQGFRILIGLRGERRVIRKKRLQLRML